MQSRIESKKHSFKTEQRNTSLYIISTGFQRCEPGYSWGPGSRDHFLIHLVTSGRGILEVDGKIDQIASGEMFLTYPGEIVQYRADLDDPWVYIWVGFDGLDAPFLIESAGFSAKHPCMPTKSEGSAVRLMNIYNSRGNQAYQVVRMTGILYDFFSHLIERASTSIRERPDPTRAIADRAADFIAGHYYRALTAEEIARHAGTSRTGLYRCLKKHYDMAPMQHVNRCRIDRACFLLHNSDLSIGRIARDVGFDDPLHFSRSFKAAKGCPPRQYRLQIAGYDQTSTK